MHPFQKNFMLHLLEEFEDFIDNFAKKTRRKKSHTSHKSRKNSQIILKDSDSKMSNEKDSTACSVLGFIDEFKMEIYQKFVAYLEKELNPFEGFYSLNEQPKYEKIDLSCVSISKSKKSKKRSTFENKKLIKVKWAQQEIFERMKKVCPIRIKANISAREKKKQNSLYKKAFRELGFLRIGSEYLILKFDMYDLITKIAFVFRQFLREYGTVEINRGYIVPFCQFEEGEEDHFKNCVHKVLQAKIKDQIEKESIQNKVKDCQAGNLEITKSEKLKRLESVETKLSELKTSFDLLDFDFLLALLNHRSTKKKRRNSQPLPLEISQFVRLCFDNYERYFKKQEKKYRLNDNEKPRRHSNNLYPEQSSQNDYHFYEKQYEYSGVYNSMKKLNMESELNGGVVFLKSDKNKRKNRKRKVKVN